MCDIFISFGRADEAIVRQMEAIFAQQGYRVWWDRHLRGASNDGYHADITAQLDAARCVLIVLSTNSAASLWVRKEVERAVGRLFPMRIDSVEKTRWPPECQLLDTIDVNVETSGTLGPAFSDVIDRVRRYLGPPAGAVSVNPPSAQLAAAKDNARNQDATIFNNTHITGDVGTIIEVASGTFNFDQRKS